MFLKGFLIFVYNVFVTTIRWDKFSIGRL